MIRSIIVDDEVKSRESLRSLVEDFCRDVSVVALCRSVSEAYEQIAAQKPDLVFLDIQLQRETGFDLLAMYDQCPFEVIFTTAYSEHAIRAFKYSAIDYLLKPIDIEELRSSIARLKKRTDNSLKEQVHQLIRNLNTSSRENCQLALPTSDGLIFVKADDILYCEASGNYTEITLFDNRKVLVTRTLKDYDEMLSGQNFYRIHHSHLINLNEVKKYIRGDGGYVIMSNDKSLDVSKRKRDGFLERVMGKSKLGG